MRVCVNSVCVCRQAAGLVVSAAVCKSGYCATSLSFMRVALLLWICLVLPGFVIFFLSCSILVFFYPLTFTFTLLCLSKPCWNWPLCLCSFRSVVVGGFCLLHLCFDPSLKLCQAFVSVFSLSMLFLETESFFPLFFLLGTNYRCIKVLTTLSSRRVQTWVDFRF